LLSHRGRLEAELGREDEALKHLTKAEQLLERRNDLEARGLLAAVKSNLWRIERAWTAGHLGDLITHTDNRALWWRTMGAGFQLADQFEDLFDESIGRYANEDSRLDHTTVLSTPAWLNATVLGDHSNAGGWLANAAKASIAIGPIDTNRASSALLGLLRSGATKDLAAFASYLWQVGPTGALQETTKSSTEALPLTRTTLLPTLELWRAAPDLMGQRAATAMDLSVRGLVGSDDDLRSLAGRGTTPWYEFGQTCSALLPWVGLRFHRRTADWVLEAIDAGYPGPLKAQLIERLSGQIRWSNLPLSIQERAAASARNVTGEDVALAGALVRPLDHSHPAAADARAAIREQAVDGDFDALMQLVEPGAGRAPRDLERLLADSLSAQANTIVEEARLGRHGYGGYRVAALQAWFSLSHGPESDWGLVFGLLGEPAVIAEHKLDICAYLADHSSDLPTEVIEELLVLLPEMRQAHPGLYSSSEHLESHVIRLGYRIGGVTADEVVDRILDWSTSTDTRDRRAAAMLLAEDLECDVGQASAWLMRLLSDAVPRVAIRAARSVGVVLPKLDPPTLSLLDRMIERDQLGCGRSLALLRGLREATAPKKAANVVRVISRLQRHPSRAVRRAVVDARQGAY
jgi:hypothetical protein